MKKFIYFSVKQLINALAILMGKTLVGRYFYARVISHAMEQTQQVVHEGLSLNFSVPNPQNKYRADSFSTKEPETLEWIDSIPSNSVIWDIGANVGIYSCYAAKSRDARVFAFEPSVFNLESLARNIYLNDLTDNVTIVPLPLSDALAFNRLNMTSTEWGCAMSTFGQDYGHDGKVMEKVFEIPTIGLTMVDAVERLNIPQPDYIKMDVDGIEHLILKSGLPVLTKAKGVLIEINDKFTTQAREAEVYMKEAGFSLKAKLHADYFDHVSTAARHTYNQIWVKSN